MFLSIFFPHAVYRTRNILTYKAVHHGTLFVVGIDPHNQYELLCASAPCSKNTFHL